MAKKWSEDNELLESMAGNLLDVLAVFPKQLIRVDELVRQFGMPLSHIQIMVTLSNADLSIGTLSERMGIAKPNITPLVDALCDKGYVERIRSLTDRRIVNVHLTASGADLLSEIRTAISSQVAEWPVQLSRSEAKEMNAALSALTKLANAIG